MSEDFARRLELERRAGQPAVGLIDQRQAGVAGLARIGRRLHRQTKTRCRPGTRPPPGARKQRP
ncbi:MAG: hypothetical protein MZV65_30870 [Chromatiales bacterium]|nr:hypothetical protein [Chromatiales bacterium]